MSNWKKIISFYEEVQKIPRYSDISKGMLELVSVLENNPTIIGLIPFVDPLTLNLRSPTAERTILIDWEPPGVYTIYLDQCGDTIETYWGDKSTVAIEDIVLKILEYRDQIEK